MAVIPEEKISKIIDADGLIRASVKLIGSTGAVATAIVDSNGDPITSFGGGTQYTDATAAVAHPVGTIPVFNNAGTITAVSAANPLPVSATISTVGIATSTKQSDGSQKTQIVDGSGNVIGATSNALDINIKSGSVVSIGTSVTPGTSATNLGKAEDAAHSSGDVGVMALAVRNDTGAVLAGSDGDYIPLTVDSTGALRTDLNGTISTNNSTTATLTANSVFTGTSEDVTNYNEIRISLIASHASASDGLSIQQSTDNSNWDVTDTYTIPATTGKTYSVPRQARYFRVVYTNGGTNQTSFRLQTILNRLGSRVSSQRAGDAYTNETDLEQQQSFLMGYNGSTWDRVRTTGTGVLSTSAVLTAGSAVIGHVIADTGSTTAVTGNVTVVQGTGSNLHTILDANSGVDIGKLTANQSVNVAQINGVTTLMGNGTTGTGSQRVTIASDNTAFSVNATLSAETTKVIGVVRNSDGAGNLLTSNSTTYTAKFGLDNNLLGTLGTAFSTAGKVDVKGADGDVFVRQATAGNLNATVVGTGIFAAQVAGGTASGSSLTASPVTIGALAKTSLPTAVSDAQVVNAMADKFGRQVVLTNGIRDIVGSATTTITASTSETTIATAVASTFLDLTTLMISNTSASATRVDIRDVTAGSVIFSIYVPAGDVRGVVFNTPQPQTTSNNNWTAQSSVSVTDLRILAQYIKNK